jgi:Cu2+-exporting ATPase/Cu+-exporting ATPase
MHCASCVARIEKTLAKQPGVESVAVNLGTEEVRINVADEHADLARLSGVIEPFGYTLHPKVSAMPPEHDMSAMTGHDHAKTSAADTALLRQRVIAVMPLVVLAAGMMAWDILAKTFGVVPMMSEAVSEFVHHSLPIMATYTLFVTGKPYLRGLKMFVTRGVADMDSLVGIGTVTAFVYSFVLTAFEVQLAPYLDVSATYYDVTIVVIGLITLGKYLEANAKAKTGDAIKKLLGLQAKQALVIRAGQELEVSIDQVVVDDVVVIKPGMKIPVDGVVIKGSSYIDESLLTGEPVPVEKAVGAKVAAGTLNTTGAFTFRASGVGADTLLAHIIAMVGDAQGSKAPLQRLADKISAVFVPVVVVIAGVSLVAWIVIGGMYLPFAQALSYGLVSFVSVLVIACPCALGLATPTAIIVGVGRGALQGILIKNAEILERLHKVDTLVVDKTGTLTVGRPEVLQGQVIGSLSESEALMILMSLEASSEHPLAQAVVSYAKLKRIKSQEVDKFINLPGQGVQGIIDGVTYSVGGPALLKQLGLQVIDVLVDQPTATIIYLATQSEVIYALAVGDKIKPEAKEAIAKLHAMGIKVIMATGDNQQAAQAVAKELGIDEVLAGVLPQDKLAKIKNLQKQGAVVAMVGDGVNDAPALAQADIGLAMATGSDVSIETGDVTLLQGDIRKIAQAIQLSKATVTTVKQNLFWAFIYNIIGIPLATGLFFPVFGWLLSPVFAGFAMAMSSVSVVSNSLRLKFKRL